MRRLEELPGRVDALTSQILQLRGSLQEEFSAMRSMITVIDSRLVANESRLGPIDSKLVAIDTRVGDVQDRLEQTRTEMRGLHEEAIARLTLLREWQGSPAPHPSAAAEKVTRSSWMLRTVG